MALSDTTGRFELTLADGRAFTVAFRHQDTAIEADVLTQRFLHRSSC